MPHLSPRPGRFVLAGFLLWSALSFHTALAADQQHESVDQFTARITTELRATNEEAALLFMEANAARDLDDFAQAEDLYGQVRVLQPDFDHAIRRLCYVIESQQRRDEAIPLCRAALRLSSSPANKAALLYVLANAAENSPISVPQRHDATRLARELLGDQDLDPALLPSICISSVELDELLLLRRCTARAISQAPDEPSSYYFQWILAMSEQDYSAAGTALETARQLGLPVELYEEMRSATEAFFGKIRAITIHSLTAPS